MSVLRRLQQAMPYAIQENIYPENKWSSILCRVYDVWRVYWKMPGIRCYQTHCLRKAFDGIPTVEVIVTVLSVIDSSAHTYAFNSLSIRPYNKIDGLL